MNKYFTVYTLLTVSIISCQKDFSIDNTQSANVITASNDSIFITKVVALDTNKTVPFDTTYILKVTYDNLKRVVKVYGKYYDNQGPNINNAFSSYNYIYTGNDSLPSKKVYIIGDNIVIDTTISHPNYLSGTMKLSKDSIIHINDNPISFQIINYNYSGNLITTNEREYSLGSTGITATQLFQVTTTNGNIVSENQNNSYATYTCIYDLKPNPFLRVFFEQNQYFDFLIADPFFIDDPIFYLQKNNILESNITRSNASSHKLFSYKYNSLNYPIEVRIQTLITANNNNSVNKIKFYYTN